MLDLSREQSKNWYRILLGIKSSRMQEEPFLGGGVLSIVHGPRSV